MTTTPGNASSNLTAKPAVVDLATWQAAREELLVREKAHTRAGDALAAARRRLPMVECNGAVEVTGADGPVPFLGSRHTAPGCDRRAKQRDDAAPDQRRASTTLQRGVMPRLHLEN